VEIHIDNIKAYDVVRSRLADQQCVILDGGVATELPHQEGQDHERLWGIEALASAGQDVLDVHRRYVDAGADVITTNTWSLPTVIEDGSLLRRAEHRPMQWMEIARSGVEVARRAIAEGGREGEVAVAFSLNGDIDAPGGPETVELLARTLADDPPDLLLVETLSVIRPSLYHVVKTLVATGLPVWLSFRRCVRGLCGVYGQHWGGPEGDAFGRAARRFEDLGVSALLVNCIPPDHVEGIVGFLRDFTDLPLGVYPNLGYYTNMGWSTESAIGGAEYAELALRWRAEGAQIVGGCCGTRPEHTAAAREALAGTKPGRTRRPHVDGGDRRGPGRPPEAWTDARGRSLSPLAFPRIVPHAEVTSAIPGTYLMWRRLFEEGIGAHQRCLDIGCGAGLQTVQLALNGATHVRAIDVDEQAVQNTLTNAFANDVADRVSAEVADLYPWVPAERYEVIVANLPQVPIDPRTQRSSHRPVDFWGRGLLDQVIAKLPDALAREGVAYLTLASRLSRARTLDLIAEAGLRAEVVAWDLHEPVAEADEHQRAHLAEVERLSDAYTLHVGEQDVLVVHLLEVRHAR
jgi:S-methylmethionine-dependent homocysteine/selenocysteine methylase/SAM-dependent methyltransferase